jgi:(p)ppGpp synthase/HD superfamily hydrolase
MGYSEAVLDCMKVVMVLHKGQMRKGGQVPYITHLWAVAALVGEYGGDEEQVMAALLHDSVEDHGERISFAQISKQFGGRVAEIVEGCTDSEQNPKPPWKERKTFFLKRLRLASGDIKLVVAADKLHNARSTVSDLRFHGPKIWSRFNAGKDDQIWYYTGVVSSLRNEWSHRIIEELVCVVDELQKLSEKP